MEWYLLCAAWAAWVFFLVRAAVRAIVRIVILVVTFVALAYWSMHTLYPGS